MGRQIIWGAVIRLPNGDEVYAKVNFSRASVEAYRNTHPEVIRVEQCQIVTPKQTFKGSE
jgi:hypothetical protein